MKYFIAIFGVLILFSRAHAASTPDPDTATQWNSAALQGIRDAKLGAPVVARALAIVHTCMYDAWAAYDDRAVGTQLGGALRRPASERTLANKERAISYAAYRALLTYTFVQSSVAAFTAKDDNPNLVLQMQSDFSPDLVYGLLAGKLDLALAANPSPNPKITMVKMCPYPGPGDWVFASPAMKGKQPYWPGTQWRYYGKPALKRAKITKHVTYHTFRHTFGTLLNANGENPKVVQELLRHASMKVTTDVYMQAVSPQKREAQSKLVKMVMKTASA